MSRISFLLLACFLLWGCSGKSQPQPQPQQSINMYNPHPEINASNLVDSVMSHIQSYAIEPVYYIYAFNINCYYEILVNDIPVESHFERSVVGSPIYLNMGITCSGDQKLTYRLYPYGDTFDGRANFDFSLSRMDGVDNFKTSQDLMEHRAPYHIEMRGPENDQMSKEVFDGFGKTFYEHTVSFQAQVPYQIEGWTAGRDLRKLDPDTLYAAVLDYYKNFKKIYENEDADLLAGLIYDSFIQVSQEKYRTREDNEGIWEEHKQILEAKEKDYFSMENSPMVFYGNGRIASLLLLTNDISLTNWSALSFKYKSGKNIMARSIGIYLYLPKGEKDLRKFKLAI